MAALTLAFVVWRLGTGPFVDGIRTIDARVLIAALAIGVVTTFCCAWRWRIVARGLGVELALRGAIAAYYRAQFLNVILPGGILGDVHRGVSHGREASDVGRGLRAVGWERSAGQLVQVLVSAVVLLLLPWPGRSAMPLVAFGTLLMVGIVLVVSRARPAAGVSRWARVRRAAAGDLREGVLARSAWPGIVVASAIAVTGYTATFLIAARTTDTQASAVTLLPIALLVLIAMVLPSIGGWGPREGITAWLFGAAGLGAAQGVTTAVVFGVMTFVATLPGAVVLVATWLTRSDDEPPPEHARTRRMRVAMHSDGADA